MVIQSSLTRCLSTRAPLSVKLPLRVSGLYNPSRFFTSSHGLFRRRSKKPTFTPSSEQQKVVKLCAERNVVVSARPGSGKTATAEAIVAAYPNLRVGVLCYSKTLQLETQRRLNKYPNGEALTLHKTAKLLFGVVVENDATLSKQIKSAMLCNKLPQEDFKPFDIIVLDEFQDCTDLLFSLINCFIRVNTEKMGGQSARLVVLGDERQSIYRFRGADRRYLTLAPELLGPISPYPFAKLSLSESFRLSNHAVQFINQAFLGGESYIKGSKAGPKPIVLRCNPFRSYALAKKLAALIKHYGAKNSAIIAPSIRRNKPLVGLANVLAEDYHIPIDVPIDDHGPLNEKVIKGKMCISTIHQFKGRERDLVILLGIDSSFFKYLGRDLPDNSCPNEVFVALTRAAEQLVLVHDAKKKLMPFVSVDALYETAEVVNMTRKKAKIALPDAPGRPLELGFILPTLVGVGDMARHVRGEYLDDIVRRDLCIRQLSPPLAEKKRIDIRHVVLSDPKRGFYEAVGDINGLVVVAAFEQATTGTVTMFDSNNEIAEKAFPVCLQQQVSWFCRQTCEYHARVSGYRPRLLQMKNHKFDWIKPKELDMARSRLQRELGDSAKNLRFEFEVGQDFRVDNKQTRLRGRADVVTIPSASDNSDNESVESIWEIKFVSKLSNQHIVQACTYAYLLALQLGRIPRTILYNVRDGNKLEITPRNGREGLRRMIESVLRLRYTTEKEMEDEALIKLCAKATREVLKLDGSRQ